MQHTAVDLIDYINISSEKIKAIIILTPHPAPTQSVHLCTHTNTHTYTLTHTYTPSAPTELKKGRFHIREYRSTKHTHRLQSCTNIRFRASASPLSTWIMIFPWIFPPLHTDRLFIFRHFCVRVGEL